MNLSRAQVRGVVAPIMGNDINTDTIIRSRDIKSPHKEGLGKMLFACWRYLSDGGEENPDFILNRPPHREATILLVQDNFGCGSSREAAVWALTEFGVRSIIGSGFGAIFYANCIINGLIPVVLPWSQIQDLASQLETGADQEVVVDLNVMAVSGPDGRRFPFLLSGVHRQMLLGGLDPIGMTLEWEPEVAAFEAADRSRRAWQYVPLGLPAGSAVTSGQRKETP